MNWPHCAIGSNKQLMPLPNIKLVHYLRIAGVCSSGLTCQCGTESRSRGIVTYRRPAEVSGHSQLLQMPSQRGGPHGIPLMGLQDRAFTAFTDPLLYAGTAN